MLITNTRSSKEDQKKTAHYFLFIIAALATILNGVIFNVGFSVKPLLIIAPAYLAYECYKKRIDIKNIISNRFFLIFLSYLVFNYWINGGNYRLIVALILCWFVFYAALDMTRKLLSHRLDVLRLYLFTCIVALIFSLLYYMMGFVGADPATAYQKIYGLASYNSVYTMVGLDRDPNFLALHLVPMIVLSFSLRLGLKIKAFAIVLSLSGIMLTQSKATMFSLALVFGLFVLIPYIQFMAAKLLEIYSKPVYILFLFCLILAILSLILYNLSAILNWLLLKFDNTISWMYSVYISNERYHLWNFAYTKLTATDLIFGTGLGSFKEIFHDTTGGTSHLHNSFFELIFELGTAGVILYAYGFYYVLRHSKFHPDEHSAVVLILGAIILNLSFLSAQYDLSTYFVLGLLAGLKDYRSHYA